MIGPGWYRLLNHELRLKWVVHIPMGFHNWPITALEDGTDECLCALSCMIMWIQLMIPSGIITVTFVHKLSFCTSMTWQDHVLLNHECWTNQTLLEGPHNLAQIFIIHMGNVQRQSACEPLSPIIVLVKTEFEWGKTKEDVQQIFRGRWKFLWSPLQNERIAQTTPHASANVWKRIQDSPLVSEWMGDKRFPNSTTYLILTTLSSWSNCFELIPRTTPTQKAMVYTSNP